MGSEEDFLTPLDWEWDDHESAEPRAIDLTVLTPKQRFVIERRYGLVDGYVCSVQELAAVMGITHQAVSRLARAGLSKLMLQTDAL